MDITIRKATENDFEKVYPLFEQLWPNKELDKEALKTVFNRGVNSDSDVLFCLDYSNEVIGFCAYAIVNNLWQVDTFRICMQWSLMKSAGEKVSAPC